MPAIEILNSGRLDERDSAYPQAVQLPNGDILCSFSVGGGPMVHGGTDWARSTDGGTTWQHEGTILPPESDPVCTNFLKLSCSTDGQTVFAYGTQLFREIGEKMGDGRRVPVVCRSTDGGHTWSAPAEVPMPVDCPMEISHGILALPSGRLLAPAATLSSKDRLAERALVMISDDNGQTWSRHSTVFGSDGGDRAYFECKYSVLPDGGILATAWTATLGDYRDLENSYAVSNDDGLTWSPARSTGIKGQTLSTCPLDSNRLLFVYNRRYGQQGIMVGLAEFDCDGWTVRDEQMLYDANAVHERDQSTQSGVDEFDAFSFGFPTAVALQDEVILVTHWSYENGNCGIRWTRLQVDWPD